MVPDSINSRLDPARPLLLDGGLGTELEARGFDISSPLWSAAAIMHDPAALAAVHRAYLEAGAMCITTASYQASVPGLTALGLRDAQIESVFTAAVDIACRARDEYARSAAATPALVAASIGPYGAYLADGSEYRGNYGLDDAELRDFHAPRLYWLDRAGADLIACETIPDLQEARILAQLLEDLATPAWVSFCCRDGASLHDGNPVEAAAELFCDHAGAFALGVNCCAPSYVLPLIGRLRKAAPDKLIVVYPNSGRQYDAEAKSWHGDESLQYWSRLAASWFAAGARIIGGCCHIGPGYIHQLAIRQSWRC